MPSTAIVPSIAKKRGEELRIVNGTNPFNSDCCLNVPLQINSCGCNQFTPDIKRVEITRPLGRKDYQLIYIQEGSGDFYFDNSLSVVSSGHLIIFKPGEPQHYSFHNLKKTTAYFIHFTGYMTEELLKQSDCFNHTVIDVGEILYFSEYVMKIYRELQMHSHNYNQMCSAYFLGLLSSLSRSLNKQDMPSQQINNFAPALDLMNNEFMKNISIEEYADLCGMSPYYFIRKFKEFTGHSPHTYVIKVRMERAKELLMSTSMNVSEVSFSIGYDNPLYFSRMFKKYTGHSPANYKKQMLSGMLYAMPTDY